MAVKKVSEQPRLLQPAAAVGSFHRQLRQPEQVGEISAAEAREIKVLNELLKKLEDETKQAQQVLVVTTNYRLQYLQGLIKARNLAADDLYNINDDTGLIFRTHELAQPEEAVEEPKGTPEN
jgi:hypothetical protein